MSKRKKIIRICCNPKCNKAVVTKPGKDGKCPACKRKLERVKPLRNYNKGQNCKHYLTSLALGVGACM